MKTAIEIWLGLLLLVTPPAHAETLYEKLTCERTELDDFGFISRSAAASWFHEKIVFNRWGDSVLWDATNGRRRFGRVISNPRPGRLTAHFESRVRRGIIRKRVIVLDFFPNGKATIQLKKTVFFKRGGTARYQCTAAPEKTLYFANDQDQFWFRPSSKTLEIVSTSTPLRHITEDAARDGEIAMSVLGFYNKPSKKTVNQVPTKAYKAEVKEEGGMTTLVIEHDDMNPYLMEFPWLAFRMRSKGGMSQWFLAQRLPDPAKP